MKPWYLLLAALCLLASCDGPVTHVAPQSTTAAPPPPPPQIVPGPAVAPASGAAATRVGQAPPGVHSLNLSFSLTVCTPIDQNVPGITVRFQSAENLWCTTDPSKYSVTSAQVTSAELRELVRRSTELGQEPREASNVTDGRTTDAY